jgi:hypothetical protein
LGKSGKGNLPKRDLSTLIHELAHVELTFIENQKLTNKIFGHINKEFSQEDRKTQIHIPVDILQLCVMAKVFPNKYEKIIAKEKSLKLSKRAWEIIDSQRDKINLESPVKSILTLKKPNPNYLKPKVK